MRSVSLAMKNMAFGLLMVVSTTGALAAGSSDVADAAMRKDIGAIRTLIQQKTDINTPQKDGATALHWAVRWDDTAMADLLIRAGAQVRAANRFGVTPLALACTNGNAPMIEKLLQAGADAGSPLSDQGETPLMMAARTGNLDAVKVLLAHHADVNAREKSKGHTALIWAAAEGHTSIVRELLASGADPQARSLSEIPPAPRRGPAAPAAAAAVPAGPPPCPAKGTPRPEPVFGAAGGTTRTQATGGGCINALIFAARQGHLETVRALLDGKADIDLPMADGSSALVLAIINAHYRLAAFLVDRGADPNLADGKGRAALYAAIDQRNYMVTDIPQPKADDMDTLELIRMILDRGANVNARLAQKLPYRGAGDPTWQSEVGATPFLRAAYSSDIAAMRVLLAYGADPNITASDKTTPLMAAAGVGWLPGLVYTRNENLVETLKFCLELGNPIDAINDGKPNSGGPFGVTALHGAAFKGIPEAIQFLVDRGADIFAKDNVSAREVAGTPEIGRIPLNWAEGLSFEGQSPRREDKAVALLQKLMDEAQAKQQKK